MGKVLAYCIAISIAGLFGLCGPAHAGANLVVNGDFEQFSNSSATQVYSPNNTANALNGTAPGVLTGWTNAGYTFLFTPGSADTTGSYSTAYNHALNLWGPNGGGGSGSSNNGLTAASPTGGNFIGTDGAYQQGAISQTISGLTVGQNYVLSFYWAAGQQTGYTGTTTDSWGVTFGSQTYSTQTITNPSQGFTPWVQAVFTFTATSASQSLSFLATGAPSGTPPFALLDGVVLTAAPEPAAVAVLLVGLLGVTLARRSGCGWRLFVARDAAAS